MSKTSNGPMLSKSRFVRGLQCHKALYLQMHSPELVDPVSPSQEAVFQAGFEVGELAQGLFPGGAFIPYDAGDYDGQIARTKAEMDKGTKVLYEAAFSYDGVFVKVDILRRGPDGWEMYEVKSAASLKDYHVSDVAVQYYVLKGAGLALSGAYLVHINSSYVRSGDIEPDKLFTIKDLTDTVKNMGDSVKEEIQNMRDMLKGEMPAIDIGPYCSSPFDCDFCGHCWQNIPEDSVFDLCQKGVNPFELYAKGIVRMRDIPLEILNYKQGQQVECFIDKKEFVDTDSLKGFLASLRYPLYFLDFETYMVAIPLYDGTSPYQQVPYQYSLHYLEQEGVEPGHYEFLADPNVDPREEIAANLCRQIPDNACILAFYARFEINRLRELAATFPRYKEKLERIIDNTIDLAIPFEQRQVYHWEMYGSFSQKVILPLLVPELRYDGMEVADGMMAMDAYYAMCASKDPQEIAGIRSNLLKYCALDTLGMVRILGRLRVIAKNGAGVKG